MKVRNFALCAAIAAALGTTACGHSPTNQEIGTAGGAVIGGAVGHAATGSTLGTIGGAAVGGVLGNEVGKRRDAR
jgi:osmotically inducible lipoprotein OsmB